MEGMCLVPPFNLEEPIIPFDTLVSPQNGVGSNGFAYPKKEPLSHFISAPPPAFNSISHPNLQDSLDKKKNAARKCLLPKPKARSAPGKKVKMAQDPDCSTSVSSTPEI